MTRQRWTLIAAVATAAAISGCSGSSSDGASPAPTHSGIVPSHPITILPSPISTVTVTSTPTSPPTPVGPQTLAVSDPVKRQLIRAGADTHQLPAKDYTGLVPGETYYAYLPKTSTYWAGAGLVPSSSSQDAQVSVQDDGSYLVFTRPAGGQWTAYNVGLSGVAGATCPVHVPGKIRKLWHWDAHSCRPPS